jgi:uncharacterized protein (TIGR03437 family)
MTRGFRSVTIALLFSIPGFSQTPILPVVADGGVVNAATITPGVTQGSLVAIMGTGLAASVASADSIPLSTSLANVSVTFNNVPAPLSYVSPTQINAQLPWNTLASGVTTGTANIVVTRQGIS